MRSTLHSQHAPRQLTALLAVAAAAVCAAGGTWLHDAGTARAPEPAYLTQPLNGSNGASAAAYFVNNRIPTDIVKWPSSYAPGSVTASTPCSPVDLAPGQLTGRVIVATGNYRKCV
jgi:hypothetical protein